MLESRSNRSFGGPYGPFVVALLFGACGEEAARVAVPIPDEPALTEAQVRALDEVPTAEMSFDDLVLQSGEKVSTFTRSRQGLGEEDAAPSGSQLRRKNIIAQMLASAWALTDRSAWQYSEEGDDAPAQDGLAYSYGSKDPDVRQIPPGGGCQERVHGLDCSGLVRYAATAAGIALPLVGSAAQASPATWNAVLPQDWGLRVDDVTGSAPESGDIIGWAGHIGIIAKDAAGSLIVLQSNGTAALGCANMCSVECEKNRGPSRGPRKMSLASANNVFGSQHKLLRLVVEISGKWDFRLRCAGRENDAATMTVQIDNRGGGPFEATGSGTDYNGSALGLALAGTYDAAANKLDGTLSLTTDSRSDHFAVRLDNDDTGYFPLTKVIDNGGCSAEARLISAK